MVMELEITVILREPVEKTQTFSLKKRMFVGSPAPAGSAGRVCDL